MVEGHLNHPKICIASRYQKRTFEGTGITFKIISFLNLTLKTCQLWQMWVSVKIDKDLFTLSKLSTDSKSKLGSLMAHLQKLGCWLQLKSSLPTPQSFGQKETPHPQSHKYISFNSADTTFKNVVSIISEIRCENRFYCVADLLSVWTNRSVDNFLELFAQPGANRHLLRAKDG